MGKMRLPISIDSDLLYRDVLSLRLNFFHLLARKTNLEKNYIYSINFFHNFHSSESSFTCSGLRTSGLARRLVFFKGILKLILTYIFSTRDEGCFFSI